MVWHNWIPDFSIEELTNPPPQVAVLRLSGIIGAFGHGRRGLTLAGLERDIERAFSLKRLSAVALAVNSPGGAPVQAGLIAGRIRALSQEKHVPVVAFVEDVAASGGYWLALAADEIYADVNSILGSVGVITAGFGFPQLLEKLGVERRVYATGDKKAMLDPFKPEKADDVLRLKKLQEEIHASFVELVKARRGRHLKGEDKDLFSGDVWTGIGALDRGLIDGLGDLRSVMRQRYGDKVKFRRIGGRRGLLARLGLGAERETSDPLGPLLETLEERAWWARYGL